MHALSQHKNKRYPRTISRGTQYQRGAVPRSTRVVTTAPRVCITTAARNAAARVLVGASAQASVVVTIGERIGSSAKAAGWMARRSLAQRVWRSTVRLSEQATLRFCTAT